MFHLVVLILTAFVACLWARNQRKDWILTKTWVTDTTGSVEVVARWRRITRCCRNQQDDTW
ncbi:hypothetical protein DPMN_005717 [Dreissena polymorpha]|uniref:Secreted protein n=1 Tax=Dreissena polymorpha TaxID=45954 RepID=A0A9D4RWS4_DREPO|nr:hypothetical protein DPMN_005717 [Dreissena polymorpha]